MSSPVDASTLWWQQLTVCDRAPGRLCVTNPPSLLQQRHSHCNLPFIVALAIYIRPAATDLLVCFGLSVQDTDPWDGKTLVMSAVALEEVVLGHIIEGEILPYNVVR